MGLSSSLGFGYPTGDAEDPGEQGDLTPAGFEELVASLPPGAGTIAFLVSLDPDSLDESCRHALLEAFRRCEAWLAAASLPTVVSAMHPSRLGYDDEWLRDEVAVSLRLSPGAAESKIDIARALTGPLPGTMEALLAGDISYRHAQVMTELCGGLDAATAAAVEVSVLAAAAEQTPAAFRRSVKRAKIRAAPDMAAADVAGAVRFRDVVMYPADDGMAVVCATLPAAGALTLYRAIDLLAHAARDEHRDAEQPGDPIDDRGIGAWRADVLMDFANAWMADPMLPKLHGRPVQAQIVIDLPTALGLAEHPAELVGYGPLPAAVARELIADSDWRRFITEPLTGALLDAGRFDYRPRAALEDFTVTKDRSCRFPYCTRAAIHCDIDHRVPFAAGGQTTRDNCNCLCRRHHRMKTFGGWLLEKLTDCSLLWTSPCGRTYIVPPQRFLDTG